MSLSPPLTPPTHHRSGRVVLTGGPGAGKSVISRELAGLFPDRLIPVPESATQVYTRLNTRWDRLDLDQRRDVQRQIYHNQLEQERRLALAHPHAVLLLDRGTIDGAAYWPEGPAAYWADLGTDHRAELARYDMVIWLETAAALGIYDGDGSNAVRFEDADGAVRSGKTLLDLWGNHPTIRHVGAFVNLSDKVAAVREIIETLNTDGQFETRNFKSEI